MELYIDQNRRESNGKCIREYPQLFRFQEGTKKAVVINPNLPERYWRKYTQIAGICPVRAIRIQK